MPASGRITPEDVAAYTPNPAVLNPYEADPTAPAAPQAPAAPPTANTTSPGIILNGKPLDEKDAK